VARLVSQEETEEQNWRMAEIEVYIDNVYG